LKHPTKAREENKIDGPVALFMGLGRGLMATRCEAGFVNLNTVAA
jgi:phage terminase large subunit-like protein